MHLIGIDAGTSAIKAVLVDDQQIVHAESSRQLGLHAPHPRWFEQNPDDWWVAVCEALELLRQSAGSRWQDVRGIGLSGQMHGAVLLNQDGKVLRPAILWNDGRSDHECRELAMAMPDIGTIAGVPAMPGLTAPKLLWLRRHEPELHKQIAHVLLPKDYIRFRLTGERLTDVSDAAGTLWLDQARRAWSSELLAASGMSELQMPRLLESPAAGGEVLAVVAGELGLPAGVLVAAGAGDAAAGAIGIGAINEGDAFLSLGTSAQMLVATMSFRPMPEKYIHAFCHAVPDRWFQMAAMLNGAACLAWIARQLNSSDIGSLLRRAEAETTGPSELLFLPYLTGERTPHNDPSARGAFIGLGAETTPSAIVRAVLEGVAFSCVDARDCLTAAGSGLAGLAVIGGGAQSSFWCGILASALNLPLTRYEGGENGPAFGAARLARLALTGEPPAAVCIKPAVRDIIAPDPDLADAYMHRQPHFRDLYSRLKGAFVPA
jgi:xylulokinase